MRANCKEDLTNVYWDTTTASNGTNARRPSSQENLVGTFRNCNRTLLTNGHRPATYRSPPKWISENLHKSQSQKRVLSISRMWIAPWSYHCSPIADVNAEPTYVQELKTSILSVYTYRKREGCRAWVRLKQPLHNAWNTSPWQVRHLPLYTSYIKWKWRNLHGHQELAWLEVTKNLYSNFKEKERIDSAGNGPRDWTLNSQGKVRKGLYGT